MSRKPETTFSRRIRNLKKLNKSYYFQSIETSTSRGVCDLFTIIKGRSFWLEIKVNHGKKVSKNIGLSKYQQALFRAGICDECLDTKTILGTIKFVRDYIYGDTEYISLKKARNSLNESGKMGSL
jgi:hypothetical protein